MASVADPLPIDDGPAWRCRSSRFPQDFLIREFAGYRIWSRPINGPAIWMRQDRTLVEHDDAVKEATIVRECALKRLEKTKP